MSRFVWIAVEFGIPREFSTSDAPIEAMTSSDLAPQY